MLPSQEGTLVPDDGMSLHRQKTLALYSKTIKPSSEQMNDGTAKENLEERSQPPNGGLQAWLHVLAGFFVITNTWQAIPRFLRLFFLVYIKSTYVLFLKVLTQS